MLHQDVDALYDRIELLQKLSKNHGTMAAKEDEALLEKLKGMVGDKFMIPETQSWKQIVLHES